MQRSSSYVCQYRTEVESIASQIHRVVDERYSGKDLLSTPVLCRYFLLAVFDLISGCFQCLERRNYLANKVLSRSLIEHNTDMHFLSLHGSKEYNRKFANYHLLWLYWHRDDFKYVKESIYAKEDDYRIYVDRHLGDEIRSRFKGKPVPTAKEIDHFLKNKYTRHWSGLGFPDRVERVEKKTAELHPERLDYDDTPRGRGYKLYFNECSNFIHSTPFGILPHFAASQGVFETSRNYADEVFEHGEEFMILAIDYAVTAFADSLEESEQEKLRAFFEDLLSKSPNINRYFFGDTNPCN